MLLLKEHIGTFLFKKENVFQSIKSKLFLLQGPIENFPTFSDNTSFLTTLHHKRQFYVPKVSTSEARNYLINRYLPSKNSTILSNAIFLSNKSSTSCTE